jgi:hyperosmotically inducible protein
MFAVTDREAVMKKMSTRIVRMLAIGGVAACLSAAAPLPANAAIQSQNATAGAAQQSNQSNDLDITRNIRRALIKDKSLSVRAHNVTIITKDGKVTLKGRVDSAAEKQTVESAASNIAGVGNVDDQLTTSSQ